ncbi:uncharacterized protein Nmag_2687 [Natrialba magadii ATCC 43099]|uniref:Uncharacterized protein n=1 Tax=Natrialba magadii (strain ATCC 43099 / DSM 3394 / CCM 3739 / CIP 104546 / IAM 13178 / JCM 8861 / NBRC 102185 / NCIMB 2190 / MS3) TaxID=547559 RepID=D3SZ51_NATMM|nr:hypothetical protein [Natrialba magadii]ADD06243.1 uncharacterized protein Nmag_2687 [Natrialba magadii ATCC 43099]ELY31043.1 hypothetical protein C500_06961 [Natrialba magadii ATCC 43099]
MVVSMTARFDDHTDESTPLESASHEPADLDARTEIRCYRCDRAIETDHWICLTTRPGPDATNHYEATSRPCCPDCVAAIGLLEFAADPGSGSGAGSAGSD